MSRKSKSARRHEVGKTMSPQKNYKPKPILITLYTTFGHGSINWNVMRFQLLLFFPLPSDQLCASILPYILRYHFECFDSSTIIFLYSGVNFLLQESDLSCPLDKRREGDTQEKLLKYYSGQLPSSKLD